MDVSKLIETLREHSNEFPIANPGLWVDFASLYLAQAADALTAERERADQTEKDRYAERDASDQRILDVLNERDDLTRKLAEAERQAGVWLNATADEKLKNKAIMEAMRKIADTPAWGAPDRWETTPAEVRQFARAFIQKQEPTHD